jgi:DNA (cytosine-5)-methyltransferase 3A
MRIISLFDGVSCARVALDRVGIPVEEYYSCEIDKYAIQISKKNYPRIKQMGDVKEFGFRLKDIDLLIGGSPCQDLSIAKRNRKGLSGDRSGLFWEYVRILNEVKPKFFILENVNSMPKEAKALITETLGVEPIMINASLLSAQNRKRLFWVGAYVESMGYLRVNVTQPEDRGILLKDILEKDVDEKYFVDISKMPKQITMKENSAFDYYNNKEVPNGKAKVLGTNPQSTTAVAGQLIRIGKLNSGGQGDRIYSPEGKSVGLSALGGGRGAKTGLYLTWGVASRTRSGKKQIEHNGLEKANAMTSVQTDSMVDIENKIRKLTPVECERLQGLPDNYTEGVSNSQRYKMLGNAFNVDVVAHILSFISNSPLID